MGLGRATDMSMNSIDSEADAIKVSLDGLEAMCRKDYRSDRFSALSPGLLLALIRQARLAPTDSVCQVCPTCNHEHSGSAMQFASNSSYSGCETCGWCY